MMRQVIQKKRFLQNENNSNDVDFIPLKKIRYDKYQLIFRGTERINNKNNEEYQPTFIPLVKLELSDRHHIKKQEPENIGNYNNRIMNIQSLPIQQVKIQQVNIQNPYKKFDAIYQPPEMKGPPLYKYR